MIVTVTLDQPHAHYTNLDVISGKVHLRVPSPGNISSVVVKLEGEARTRLLAPVRPDRPDRQKPVLEVHKLLYKIQVVWPPNTRPEDAFGGGKASYMIEAGSYEYPFQFKLPLNNACQQTNSLATNVNFTGMALEMARTPTFHVKQTLPPSLSGYPGEAEIKYYVKVTVNRPSLFKENPRNQANFTFLPIEPPRPAQADGEKYARRQHQFLEHAAATSSGKRRSFLGGSDKKDKDRDAAGPPSPSGSTPPRFSVDARLPNPAVLTCNQDIPLRILVKSMSERSKNVYLQMLQIELIGYTRVRAHEVSRNESNSWLIASFSNMAIPLGSPTDAPGTEVPINPEYWSGKSLPNTICPSFQTCNLERFYELEVRVGLGYGSYKHGEDQFVVLPLRLPVKVYSGIKPPQALLERAMTTASSAHAHSAGDSKIPQAAPIHSTPHGLSHPQQQQPHQQAHAQPGPAGHADMAPPYDDAPPSYEDAIGDTLPPVNGYRGSYHPPPVPEGAPRISDEKRR